MKTLIAVIIALFLGQFGFSQQNINSEEEIYNFKNVLKLSPIELGRAEFQVGYEHYFNERKQSFLLMPSAIIGKKGNEERSGFQLMLQYRFYLSQLQRETNETLNMYNIGFYAAPYALGLIHSEVYEMAIYDPISYEMSYKSFEENVKAIEGGALMGIQLDITKRIVFDFYVGGGIRSSEVEDNNSDESYRDYGIFDLGYTGVKPRIGMQMGITF